MLSTPTPDQVRSLAPDAAAARAGEGLAIRRRWAGTGRDDRAAWGLCQGSASEPYQVVVDFSGPAFRCTCPSRKFPCKHGLGLLFLLAAESTLFPAGDAPEWATEWLASRSERSEAAEARQDARKARVAAGRAGPVDAAARDRRIQARERKVDAGLLDLDRWLQDLVRRGLASVKSEGYRFWDQAGARLVDAQAASLAREVRALGATINSGTGWAEWALERIGRIHLIVEAYRRLDELPSDLRYDVRSLVGWTIKEDELATEAAVTDRWLVVGRTVTSDERLSTARTWLLGETTGRFALHLAFAPGGTAPVSIGLPGSSFRAALVFYPSATPQRVALTGTPDPAPPVASIPDEWTRSIAGTAAAFTDILARNPFATSWPAVLADVVPVGRDGQLVLHDSDGSVCRVQPQAIGARLIATAGGTPITAFGVWTGSGFRVLSAITEGRVVDLGTDTTDIADDADQDPGLAANRSTDGSAWGELVSTALLGTERGALPDTAPMPKGDALAGRPTESRLLGLAGIAATTRRAGFLPPTDEGPLPEPAPPDDRTPISMQAARMLRQTFDEHPELVPEWLDRLAGTSHRLPDEELPTLLRLAARNRQVRKKLAPVLGPRARWLVGQVPDLADGFDVPTSLGDAWEAASTPEMRAAAIAEARASDRAAARELLDTAWADLTARQRALTLAELAAGLSADDRPLLERALADTRAEVRSVAVELLIRLPDSELARLAEDVARPTLQSAGRARRSLEVEPPAWSEDLARLAIPRKPPQGAERAWLLRQVIGRVAPSRWEAWLGDPPAELIARARRTEQAAPIVLGWIDATRRFRDGGWARALLDDPAVASTAFLSAYGGVNTSGPTSPQPPISGWQSTPPQPTVNLGDDPLELLEVLDPANRQAVGARLVRELDAERAMSAAGRTPGPWSREMDDAVLDVVRREGQLVSKAFVELCRLAAHRMSPSRADEFEDVVIGEWNRLMTYPGLGQFLDLIDFRRQIARAFTDAAS